MRSFLEVSMKQKRTKVSRVGTNTRTTIPKKIREDRHISEEMSIRWSVSGGLLIGVLSFVKRHGPNVGSVLKMQRDQFMAEIRGADLCGLQGGETCLWEWDKLTVRCEIVLAGIS